MNYAALILVVLGCGSGPPDDALIQQRLDRVQAIHGGTGPWAVAGYRIGERAMKEFGQEKHSFALAVVHRCPAEVQYSCMADGLQAATGASAGKLNLKVEEVGAEKLSTTVVDKKTGRKLTFKLKPEFVRSILNLPFDRLEAEGKRVAGMDDDAIFVMEESK